MKKYLIYILIIVGLAVQNCKTKKEVLSTPNEKTTSYKQTAIGLNLKAPINSADKNEANKEVYNDGIYSFLQRDWDKFKDNAPFIELIDGGKKERLWYSSSRADGLFYGKKNTNHYQQIYYCDREIEDGKMTGEGWSKPNIFKVETDNPFYMDFTDQFNNSTKGAVTLSNNLMIFSSDLILEGGNSEFKDLWEINRVDGKFINPKPILELSHENTWESQPTLSSDGKHLFFISNRRVLEDGTIDETAAVNDFNVFYSFKSNDKWDAPVLVKEIMTESNEVTPSLKYDNKKLYFSSNRNGNFDIYEVDIVLKDEGGYEIENNSIIPFSDVAIDVSAETSQQVQVNDSYDQQYPFFYFNPINQIAPRAIYWASNDPEGYGSYDLYACTLPYVVQYNVELLDVYKYEQINSIEQPVIKIKGFVNETYNSEQVSIDLYAGLNYEINGGSYASEENGTFHCDIDDKYVFIGYSRINGNNPFNKFIHDEVIQGAEIKSEMTKIDGIINFSDVKSDTVVYDSILITKAWLHKPYCPGKLEIEPKHDAIAYFQTGYWEVNTVSNLKRDLAVLNEGFSTPSGDFYAPKESIDRQRSDYRVVGENPVYPVIPDDGLKYSIANARWIELHPNNYYWGDRIGFSYNVDKRLEGRTKRIDDYITFAKKVDENLASLVDTIQLQYIDLLDKHKDQKPKLLIEIFAVSDEREINRGWYFGEPVEYRGSDYLEREDSFVTKQVKIVPVEINEKEKRVLNISKENRLDINLTALRAWYGYKEIFDRLAKTEKFSAYLAKGKVALPDNDLSYDDADIIVITRGKANPDEIDPKSPYPFANNPNGRGFYDYDKIRRIDIQTRLLFEDYDVVGKDYCCDPSEE